MWRLVLMGVAVHLVLLSAVFDIYFVSPIHKGMSAYRSGGMPPAKRVVLFVADGLRASSIYGLHMETKAPYLHFLKNNIGSWGISHTQVPTESRPGHVAILAGFNEDPSAITKGWKSNPVDFDSVINQSTNAWCWGSPDIVDIFNKDNLSHIHLQSYDAHMQDFSGKNSPELLDTWVFNQVQDLFHQEKKQNCTDLCANGNVFFLHLLGLDTAGHTFKPESAEYINNIKVVDQGVQVIEKIFEDYFGDSRTAYIFTADHGMTNWGSHGDGSEHETEVPFIVWGAGIMQNASRQDIQQTDIAPFISSLVGINIPVNSLGIVPLNYLRTPDVQKARIIVANLHQLFEQYIAKHNSIKAGTASWAFQPFLQSSDKFLQENIMNLSYLTENHYYQEAIHKSYNLISVCTNGLKYYCSYYQNILLFFVTVGFTGWIVYLFISINEAEKIAPYHHCVIKSAEHLNRAGLGFLIIIMCCMLIYAHSIPFKYYLYCTFPIFTWLVVIKNYKKGLTTFSLLATYNRKDLVYITVGYVAGVELLMCTFFERKCLCIIFLYLAGQAVSQDKIPGTPVAWILGQCMLGLCPLLLNIQTNYNSFSQIFTCLLWIYFRHRKFPKKLVLWDDAHILTFQSHALSLAFLNSLCVNLTIMYGLGLLLINQLISCGLLGLSLILPLFVSTQFETRVISASVALMVPYTLMAVGYEGLYMFFFVQHMLNWLSVECIFQTPDRLPALTNNKKLVNRSAYQHSVKRCFYLLAFIMLSYFGVGNTASMNSFDPTWVRCFVTVFSPFTMAGLIIIKLIIPFLIVLCVFATITRVTNTSVRNSFFTVLLFCDIMVIQLLYFVKNEGSWLEIGISLSRFLVANVTTIVLILLYQIATFLTTKRIVFLSQ